MNTLLKDQGIAIEVQGIQYGVFELESRDTVSGTLNYRHRMPSRFGEYERVDCEKTAGKIMHFFYV